MEKQVCSLEIAEKLQTAGIRQDSIWYWVANMPYDSPGARLGLAIGGGCWLFETDFHTGIVVTNGVYWSAFTVSELAAMLPINKCFIRFCDQNHHGFLEHENVWVVEFSGRSVGLKAVSETLADALGYTVLMLKERELI